MAKRPASLQSSKACCKCLHPCGPWAELEERAKGVAKLAAVDAEAERALSERMDVNGFPTLMAVEAGRLFEYDGGREAEEMLAGSARRSALALSCCTK